MNKNIMNIYSAAKIFVQIDSISLKLIDVICEIYMPLNA